MFDRSSRAIVYLCLFFIFNSCFASEIREPAVFKFTDDNHQPLRMYTEPAARVIRDAEGAGLVVKCDNKGKDRYECLIHGKSELLNKMYGLYTGVIKRCIEGRCTEKMICDPDVVNLVPSNAASDKSIVVCVNVPKKLIEDYLDNRRNRGN